MNPIRLLFCATLLVALPAWAQDHKDHKEADKDYSRIIPKDYPLATCIVTDEKFGEHGEPPVAYTHQESGKPGRLIVFCCEHCVEDFKREPAKYLRKYDEEVAKKGSASGQKQNPADKKK